ncbi:MAG: T9SS type A sorting domain-containing protein [Acidobacteriota bacterium]
MKTLSFVLRMLILMFVSASQMHAQAPIWKQIDGLYGGTVRSFCAAQNGYLFAATDGGVYRSTNNGGSWTRANLGGITYNWVSVVALHPSGTILAATDGSFYYSNDLGESWQLSMGSYYDIRALIFDSTGRIYAGAYRRGILTSIDTGKTWTRFALDTVQIYEMHQTRSGVWYALAQNRVYRSNDAGKSWRVFSTPDVSLAHLTSLSDGTLFARSNQFIHVSHDDGETWYSIAGPTTTLGDNKSLLYVDRSERLILGAYSGIYISSDKGASWQRSNYDGPMMVSMWQGSSGVYYAGSISSGVYTSADGKAWQSSSNGMTASTMWLACETPSGALIAATHDAMYLSRDNGTVWAKMGLITAGAWTCGVVDSHGHIFLSCGSGIVRSTDNGATWTAAYGQGLPSICAMVCTADDAIVAASTDGDVYRSSDEGKQWKKVRERDGKWALTVMAVLKDGSIVIDRNGEIFRSEDTGTSWKKAGTLPASFAKAFVVAHNGALIAATSSGVFLSLDRGTSWSESMKGLSYPYTTNLTIDESGTVYASGGRYIFRSVDNGKSWMQISRGVETFFVTSIKATRSGYVFAGTQSYGLYRTIDAMPPRVEPDYPPVTAVTAFSLGQNYPNPFNGQTKIEFSLFESGTVQLTVYDYLGREVTRLLDGPVASGYHTATWNAEAYPAGVYFYTLRTESHVETKRLILLK